MLSGDIREHWRNRLRRLGSGDGQQQVDGVPAPIELDAGARWIPIGPVREAVERWTDQLIDLRWFSYQAFPRIASAREDAYLQSERLWVIVLAKLDADAVLAGVVEGAVVLAAAESNRVFDLLHALTNSIDFVGDTLEHHRGLSPLDNHLLRRHGRRLHALTRIDERRCVRAALVTPFRRRFLGVGAT